jgi:hypothetical protein
MEVYVFQAALLCDSCAHEYMTNTEKPAHVDTDDQTSYDSDEWPKGAFYDSGGEADSPQHCDHCELFLENALTGYGETYVRDAFREYVETGRGKLEVLADWKAYYDYVWDDFESITYADMLDDNQVKAPMAKRYSGLEAA